MDNQTLQTIIGILGSVGLLAGGIGFLFSKFKKGEKEEKADVINSADQLTNFWKEQVDGFREVIKELRVKLELQAQDFNKELQNMGKELGELKGRLAVESKQKEEYLSILQNRDPATKQFMEHMVKAMENQDRMLSEIYKMTKEEHERDLKITATVTKDGDKK